jgi:hypothetical protein
MSMTKCSNSDRICPLLTPRETRTLFMACRGGDCAWWDDVSKMCAVALLATRFDAVTSSEDTLRVSDETPEDHHA